MNKNLKTGIQRRRGRPSKNDDTLSIDRVIIDAAAEVCAVHGFHGTTVELILQQAGISRPTFYRFFKNKEDVLKRMAEEINQELVITVSHAVEKAGTEPEKIETAVDAYLDWGIRRGEIVSVLYSALSDPAFPIPEIRENTFRKLTWLFVDELKKTDRPAFDPLFIDALINTVEYLGTFLFTGKGRDMNFVRVRGIILYILKSTILGNRGEDSFSFPVADYDVGNSD